MPDSETATGSTGLESAARERGWREGAQRFVYEYTPEREVYDSNRDGDRYDPVVRTSDFEARVYLEPGERRAKLAVNLGRSEELLEDGLPAGVEALDYGLEDPGVEAEPVDTATPGEFLESLEQLAEFLSEGSMERWVETSERLEWDS